MCTPTQDVWQPAGCVSCELVCVCVSFVRVVIICPASTHTALVSSPSLAVLHLSTYLPAATFFLSFVAVLLPVFEGVSLGRRWCPCATGPTAQGHRKQGVDPPHLVGCHTSNNDLPVRSVSSDPILLGISVSSYKCVSASRADGRTPSFCVPNWRRHEPAPPNIELSTGHSTAVTSSTQVIVLLSEVPVHCCVYWRRHDSPTASMTADRCWAPAQS